MKTIRLDFLKSKHVRYGGYAAIIIFAVLAGLLIVNLIVGQLEVQVDMTESRLYSLSEQTEQVLAGLDEDVTIYGLYRSGNEASNVVEAIRKYQRASNMVKFESIDPELFPAFSRKYDVTGEGIAEGSLIVESGDQFKIIDRFDIWDVSYNQSGQARVLGFKVEQQITNAILFVTSGLTNKIYELTGHGEPSFSLMGLAETIEKENYQIEELNLVTSNNVPEDASVVVIISPKFDINEAERDKLIDYLENGGRAMIFFDFLGSVAMPNFDSVLDTFGVALLSGIVMEGNLNYLYQPNPYSLAPELLDHEILKPLSERNMRVLMSSSLGIREVEIRKRNIELIPLLRTSTRSFVRTDLDEPSIEKVDGDLDGPANVIVAVKRRKSEMSEPEGYRLIISGAGENFFRLISNKGNIDFFLNSLAWTNFRDESITVRSKSLFKFPLEISGNVMLIYFGIFIILIPLAILVSGLVVWLRRRHL